MFCKHIYGPLKDGVQYCNLCNKAHRVECAHKWVEKEVYKAGLDLNRSGRVNKIIHLLQCSHCGEMKNHVLEAGY
jgi:hypothetical protein